VISDRRMPKWCVPRWQVFDRTRLAQSGAVAIWLGSGRVDTVQQGIGDHPWHPQAPPPYQLPRKNTAQAVSIDRPTPAATRTP
jgi:competence protein ComEC